VTVEPQDDQRGGGFTSEAINAVKRSSRDAYTIALGHQPVSGEARRGPRRVLLDAHLAHLVLLSAGAAALTAHPGQRPRARALARAQSAAGTRVLSTLIPGNVPLDDAADRRLLDLLDSTHDRPALAAQLATMPEALEPALQRLARHGLISR
jgi:hypothetical protein